MDLRVEFTLGTQQTSSMSGFINTRIYILKINEFIQTRLSIVCSLDYPFQSSLNEIASLFRQQSYQFSMKCLFCLSEGYRVIEIGFELVLKQKPLIIEQSFVSKSLPLKS